MFRRPIVAVLFPPARSRSGCSSHTYTHLSVKPTPCSYYLSGLLAGRLLWDYGPLNALLFALAGACFGLFDRTKVCVNVYLAVWVHRPKDWGEKGACPMLTDRDHTFICLIPLPIIIMTTMLSRRASSWAS